jgi:nitrite reductase/ring-hydroxylating ferredoxin subunit
MKLVALCAVDEVWEGAIRQAVMPGGHKVALYNLDGEISAIDDTCTHGEASLAEDGRVGRPQVECTWHKDRFDLRSGAACTMSCSQALRSWTVSIVDG